jgi:phosphate transport system substrate-binding protein
MQRLLFRLLVFGGLSLPALVQGQGVVKAQGETEVPVVSLQLAGPKSFDVLMTEWKNKLSSEGSVSRAKVTFSAKNHALIVSDLTGGRLEAAIVQHPLTQEETDSLSAPVQHTPLLVGGTVVVYNLNEQGRSQGLKLSRSLMAKIFSGKLKSWDAPEVLNINPDLKVKKGQPLVPVFLKTRGSSQLAVDSYLKEINSAAAQRKKSNKLQTQDKPHPVWDYGIEASDVSELMALVHQNPGAIAVLDYSLAVSQNLSMAQLQNKNGEYVSPGRAGFSEAARVFQQQKAKYKRPVDLAGAGVYPLTEIYYVVAFSNLTSGKMQLLKGLRQWIQSEGQEVLELSHFTPLPGVNKH